MKVWNTLKTTYKVSDFLGWHRAGGLRLNPFFQRRSVWKPEAKSYFIDTILRGFPIPIIFLRDMKSNLRSYASLRDVVDGQQRLRTVIAFIAPDSLKDFDPDRDVFKIEPQHNKKYGGMGFADLDADVQNIILDYQFTVNVFPSDTADGEVKQVFARMNSSGYKLNDQELRNAEFYGLFKTLMYELATEYLPMWREWKVFNTDSLARMLEVELTSELAILMIKGVSEKSQKAITGVYRDLDKDFPGSIEIARRFRVVMDALEARLGAEVGRLFRKRTLFYALFAAVYELTFPNNPKPLRKALIFTLTKKQIAGIWAAGLAILNSEAPKLVMEATTRRTSHVHERTVLKNYLIVSAKNGSAAID